MNNDTNSSDISLIKSLLRIYQDSVNNSDVDRYLKHYTDDIIWMPPQSNDARTISDIKVHVTKSFKNKMTVELEPYEIEVMGEFAYVTGQVTGKVTLKDEKPSKSILISFMWLLKRQKDDWKIFRQIWNNKPTES